MDLEMIQDLLGEPNLPPPPSVQDLLPDVEPLARTPSPPPPTLACPGEHSYSKVLHQPARTHTCRQHIYTQTVKSWLRAIKFKNI